MNSYISLSYIRKLYLFSQTYSCFTLPLFYAHNLYIRIDTSFNKKHKFGKIQPISMINSELLSIFTVVYDIFMILEFAKFIPKLYLVFKFVNCYMFQSYIFKRVSYTV